MSEEINYSIGIDNGPTGRVTVLDKAGKVVAYLVKPTKKARLYTKKVAFRNRLDWKAYAELLRPFATKGAVALLERPFTGQASTAALSTAFLEAELIALDELGIQYGFCDSRDWQTPYLDLSSKSDEVCTKVLSLRAGNAKWPSAKFKDDADSAFIALLLHDVGLIEIDSWRPKAKKPKKKKEVASKDKKI
jgi:hypothetical protein